MSTIGRYSDEHKLKQFAQAVDVITFEFENIPSSTINVLANITEVRPGFKALDIAQNRIKEKNFISSLGINTAKFKIIETKSDLKDFLAEYQKPLILKTATEGYDGKGQYHIENESDIEAITIKLSHGFGKNNYIAEGFVDFCKEFSVIITRNENGELITFPLAENQHRSGILDLTRAPATINERLQGKATQIAITIAEQLNLIGLLTVEFFLTMDGEILVNEIAPRPHNSGHWTIDACVTSQFEQLIRAICGLPFGSVEALCAAEMKNLIGEEVKEWPKYIVTPNTKLHLYGKDIVKEGRKMGHVTTLSNFADENI
jgi:5-(carboxyamino)imidazole ribonucleotide synthase